MKLTVTLVEGDPQTKKPAVQMHHFYIYMCQARGMETTAFAVGDGFIKNYARNMRNLEKMIAHGPPLSLLQDKT